MIQATFAGSICVEDIMEKYYLWNLPKDIMPLEVKQRVKEAIAEAYNRGAVKQYQHDVKVMDKIRKEKK